MKSIKTLIGLTASIAMLATPLAFSAPVLNNQTLHTTTIHTNREIARGWVTVEYGKGDKDNCQKQETKRFALTKVKDGDTFQLTNDKIPDDDIFSCVIENYHLIPLTANKNVRIAYNLGNDGKSYTGTDPSEQDISIE